MGPPPENGDNQHVWLLFVLLMAMCLSVICVYSSTYLALRLWPDEIAHAQMLAETEANYEQDPLLVKFAPISAQIIIQVTEDSLGLSTTGTPMTIDVANPPARETPVQIARTEATRPGVLPAPVISTATSSRQPTSEPATLTPFPTSEPIPTQERETATATMVATAVATFPASLTPTQTETAVPPTATFTAVPQPTLPPSQPSSPPTPRPQPTATPPTPTLTPMPPPTVTATATSTSSPTPTATSTLTPTPTATATATLPPTNTPTPTPTMTPTATATSGPPPCNASIPAGEPDIGLPDGSVARVGCGQSIVVDLGVANAITVTGVLEPAFDLIYYEFENPTDNINLDWVIVEVGTSDTGPWIQVFYWGDDILDSNTNIGQAGYGVVSEPDNHTIPFSDLYGGNSPGVAIDIDAVAAAGTYQWVRITTPLGGANDAAEVDSLAPSS